MERLLALYQAGSSIGAIVALVVANLLPLAGVLFWGWDLWTILALYWVENGIVGAYNILKILLAEGDAGAGPGAALGLRLTAAQRRAFGMVGRAGTAIFFAIHYGGFWTVHGIFVLFALPSFGAGPGEIGGVRARMDLVVLGAIALAISHGVSFLTNYLGQGEYRRTTPQAQMGMPYARVVILHLTIIFGALISQALGAPIGALLVLIALKIVLDLALHLREHRGPRQPEGVVITERA